MKHPITWSEVKTYAALTGAFTVVVVILRVIGVIP